MALTLRIEKLVHGGLGIARGPKGTVFVSGAVPGELVEVEVTGRRASTEFARISRIVEPAADRRTPFCPHAGVCGGCDWQHIRYERQVALKREILLECFRRQGKLERLPEIEVVSADEKAYRMRAQLKLDRQRSGVGFYERATNTVAPIESCPLLVPELDRFVAGLRARLASLPRDIEHVKAIAGTDGAVASLPVIRGLSVAETAITVAGTEFRVSGDSFFQNNLFLVERLGQWPAERVGGQHCLDLYGGAGFFAAFVAPRFADVCLVEEVPSLVRLAGDTFRRHGLNHCRAVHATAERFLASATGPLDCVIADPPRQGLDRAVVDGIRRLAPQTLVYVSCDPATLARDVGLLVTPGAYTVAEVALFDLYPNTHHLESVVLMRRQ